MAKFKARARAIDMLGRQQIQGIPTALHELFKNAHDAYADHVEVDFYRKSNILLLRDDGIGMTREDFESRWLTVGTESKLNQTSKDFALHDPDKKLRKVMGEKGIGRLAIAVIGPQVLILTRAKRKKKLGNITVCFINWGLFELPCIDLNEIDIPITEVSKVSEITEELVESLVNQTQKLINKLSDKTDAKIVKRIKSELKGFRPPVKKLLNLSYGPSLLSEENGSTQFLITPVDENLPIDIDKGIGKVGGREGSAPLHRNLLGFSNTIRNPENAPILTEFRDHTLSEGVVEQISNKAFFTPEEYDIADHKIRGHFDNFGNFKGELSIYGDEFRKIEFIQNSSGKELPCGSFDIDFAYIQGDQKQSHIPPEEWKQLTYKLDRIGGLYVYKDGIRVLPYGNSDVDFLEIERRRTLGASHYFFSYRRMFGAINLTSEHNNSLSEKAGREGFQNNKAYRDFRDLLMSFFVQLAEQYFRADGAYADEWLSKRSHLVSEYEKAERRKKTTTEKKKDLQSAFNNFFEKAEVDAISEKFDKAIDKYAKKMSALLEELALEDVAAEVISLEAIAYKKLREINDDYIIIRPQGIGLNKKQEKQWRSYNAFISNELTPLYNQAGQKLHSLIGKIANDAKMHLDTRARLQSSIDTLREYSFKKVNAEQSQAKKALDEADKYVRAKISESRKLLEDTKLHLTKQILETDYNNLDDNDYHKIKARLEDELQTVSSRLQEELEAIQRQLSRVDPTSEESVVTDENAVAALETELEILRDDYTESLELAQIGMAVSVVHHEFESNVKGVRDALGSLHSWANKNDNLKTLYHKMRDGFDHLDNYLSLFTPLDKRMRRRKTKITGEAIADFVNDLFGERGERHYVDVKCTPEFYQQSISSYASLIFPVFINLIDNSFYWLSKKEGIRKITLDATEDGFSVTDNGPGISHKDMPHIFDFGYSRKLGGRGMGLYIAKTSLNKEGFDIIAENAPKSGARFIIEPSKGD